MKYNMWNNYAYLLCVSLMLACGSGLEMAPATSVKEEIAHYLNPFNVTIDVVTDEIKKMGFNVSSAGLLDASIFQIIVTESQPLPAVNSNTDAELISVGNAKILFRHMESNHVEMKIIYNSVDSGRGNQKNKIATGEFTLQLMRRLDKRLTRDSDNEN